MGQKKSAAIFHLAGDQAAVILAGILIFMSD
jgi:hypothetical protein